MLSIERKSSSRTVGFSGLLQGIDKPHQFLSRMGDGNIVMLALGSFLSEISGEGRVPKANVLGRVEDSKTQISGAALLHVGITISKLPGLVCGGRQTGITERIENRYNAAFEHYTALEAEKEKRIRKDKELKVFIAMLKKQPLAITEWNERIWITLLDTATVQRDGRIVFRFKSGREIAE